MRALLLRWSAPAAALTHDRAHALLELDPPQREDRPLPGRQDRGNRALVCLPGILLLRTQVRHPLEQLRELGLARCLVFDGHSQLAPQLRGGTRKLAMPLGAPAHDLLDARPLGV